MKEKFIYPINIFLENETIADKFVSEPITSKDAAKYSQKFQNSLTGT